MSLMTKKTYASLPGFDLHKGNASQGEIEILAEANEPLPVVFENSHLVVINDRVLFPNKQVGTYLRLFHPAEMAGAQGTVLVPRHEGRYLLVKIFRHSTRSWELEFPRGFPEPDLSVEENAAKELMEELGAEASEFRLLGEINPNSGLLATQAKVFLAELRTLPRQRNTEGDLGTIASCHTMSSSELMQAAAGGKIRDAFTLGAILLASVKGFL